jgi:hypothetical protein
VCGFLVDFSLGQYPDAGISVQSVCFLVFLDLPLEQYLHPCIGVCYFLVLCV